MLQTVATESTSGQARLNSCIVYVKNMQTKAGLHERPQLRATIVLIIVMADTSRVFFDCQDGSLIEGRDQSWQLSTYSSEECGRLHRQPQRFKIKGCGIYLEVIKTV